MKIKLSITLVFLLFASAVSFSQSKTKAIKGSLSKGKFADIIAVQGNPIDDVSILEHVKFVMKDGVVY